MNLNKTLFRRSALASVAVLVAVSLLAGCGGEAAADEPYPVPSGAHVGDEEPDTAAPDADPSDTDGPIYVDHAQGTLRLESVPERVYSLDWGVTFVLEALGVEVHGLPENAAPEALAHLLERDDVITVGTLHEPCFETIAANPADLVIVASRSAVHFDDVAAIAPTIDLSVPGDDNIAQSKATALTLGHIFDREAEAQALVEQLDATIAEINALTADAGDALIILTSGANVNAFGPGGRFGFVHDDFGFTAATMIEEDGRHGQSISFEFLLDADPDWLFVIDRDTAIGQATGAAQQVLDNDIVARTQAFQTDRIVYVDTVNWYIAGTGIVSLQTVADEVLAVLQAGHAG
jgi:iron complex transport system substrate-binding protein